MFEVICYSPLDDEWEDRRVQFEQIMGCKGRMMTTVNSRGVNEADERWWVRSFKEAEHYKALLSSVDKARAVIREAITY